jgi:hypothetical protein
MLKPTPTPDLLLRMTAQTDRLPPSARDEVIIQLQRLLESVLVVRLREARTDE